MAESGLKGKVAVVTGSSRGIGRAIALRLAGEGAAVVVTYRQGRSEAEAVAREAGNGAIALPLDLSDVGSIRALFATAQERLGPLHAVVSNAGLGFFKPHADVTEEEFDRIFASNARGVFFVLQEAARRVADGGRVVAISVAGTVSPVAGAGVNNGSRAAADQFALCLAKELGPRGVTANVVALGLTRTETMLAVVPEALREQFQKQIPLGRLGEPEDVADVVAFLCSHQGRWITGQTIRATGGMV